MIINSPIFVDFTFDGDERPSVMYGLNVQFKNEEHMTEFFVGEFEDFFAELEDKFKSSFGHYGCSSDDDSIYGLGFSSSFSMIKEDVYLFLDDLRNFFFERVGDQNVTQVVDISEFIEIENFEFNDKMILDSIMTKVSNGDILKLDSGIALG